MSKEIILPTMDQWTDQPRQRPEVEEQMSIRAAQDFIEDAGDEYYPTEKNWDYISGWLFNQGVPISRRNLMIAFRHLSDEGMLETEPTVETTYHDTPLTPERKGVKRVHAGPVLRHDTESQAASQLLREKPERLAELAGNVVEKRLSEDAANREMAGKPGGEINPDFKTRFKQSLGANQRSSSQRMTQGHARAIISERFPEMDTRSQEFSRLVSELINS